MNRIRRLIGKVKRELVKINEIYTSFVDPFLWVVSPVDLLLFLEPKVDFSLGWFNWIWSVAHVSSDFNAEISSDGSWGGVLWVGGSQKNSSGLNDVLALPNHSANWSWSHVLDKSSEEGLSGEVLVVFLEETFRSDEHLDTLEEVSLLLESADDLSNQSSLDTVGLDHDESLFHGFVLLINFIKSTDLIRINFRNWLNI